MSNYKRTAIRSVRHDRRERDLRRTEWVIQYELPLRARFGRFWTAARCGLEHSDINIQVLSRDAACAPQVSYIDKTKHADKDRYKYQNVLRSAGARPGRPRILGAMNAVAVLTPAARLRSS